MQNINKYESQVRSYCRVFPTTFTKSIGSYLFDNNNNKYIDFFAGAGALNYGHNNPIFKKKLVDYIEENGVTHSLDMATVAKEEFLGVFSQQILQKRNIEYKVQFTGPTGTNAVEAAIKLAQMVTKRNNIISFTNGYHGHSKGSLRLTANRYYRSELESDLNFATYFFPYLNFIDSFDELEYLETMLEHPGSGIDKPAALILETVQGEGGVNISSKEWLQRLRDITRKHGILMIIDDIQVGCGRTGQFFSFEDAAVKPDIVTLSKSISGYGLPMSLVLISPELDVWAPGKHTGTFRGNNFAFVTAAAAIRTYWKDEDLVRKIEKDSEFVQQKLNEIRLEVPKSILDIKGKGMIFGVEVENHKICRLICNKAFSKGLIIESCGVKGNTIKILPPLTIDRNALSDGLKILQEAILDYSDRALIHKNAVKKVN